MEWFVNSCPTKFQENTWANVNCLWSGYWQIAIVYNSFPSSFIFLRTALAWAFPVAVILGFLKVLYKSLFVRDSHFGCLSYPSIFQKQFAPDTDKKALAIKCTSASLV